MTKELIPFVDEISELDKRVYSLALLSEVDIFNASEREQNNWLGLLFDCVDLLQQSASDMRVLAKLLSKQ